MLKTVGNPSTRSGDQTILNGNLVIGTAGKGIDFSADPSAPGMTSELLDDYEEGTWTPVYTNTTPPTTPYTMDVVSAVYTKIGRQVTVQAQIRTDNVDITGASGTLRITGLPFTSLSNGGSGSVNIGFASDFATNTPIAGTIPQGNTRIDLSYRLSITGGNSSATQTSLTTGANADKNNLVFSATYFTA
jgi:hypothetical protein